MMLLDRLNKEFPGNKFEIKKISDLYYVFFNDKQLTVNWRDKKVEDLDEKEENILYIYIANRVNAILTRIKYGVKDV